MGFWDVLLFKSQLRHGLLGCAAVQHRHRLGPRWIAAAGHNGTSSISLWVLAAVFFFVPGALVINELSSRFPEEGGLYVWSARPSALSRFCRRLDLLDLHRLLLSRPAACQRLDERLHHWRPRRELAQDRTFLLTVSLAMLLVAVLLNIIGLNIGKWLQNAGGVEPTCRC
jgi:glutamate:GABA antiporter